MDYRWTEEPGIYSSHREWFGPGTASASLGYQE